MKADAIMVKKTSDQQGEKKLHAWSLPIEQIWHSADAGETQHPIATHVETWS